MTLKGDPNRELALMEAPPVRGSGRSPLGGPPLQGRCRRPDGPNRRRPRWRNHSTPWGRQNGDLAAASGRQAPGGHREPGAVCTDAVTRRRE